MVTTNALYNKIFGNKFTVIQTILQTTSNVPTNTGGDMEADTGIQMLSPGSLPGWV